MTSGTSGWDACLFVVRVVRAVVILHVARGTVCAAQIEVSVYVTLRTLQSGVRSRQRKSHQTVIKSCGLPRDGCVASLAGLGKVQTHVIRVRCLAEIWQVASDTVRRCPLEFSTDVASRAVESCVHPSQRKSGVFEVIELHSKPVIETVALLTRGGKVCLHVARSRRLLVVRGVTGITLGRESLELPGRRAFMA